MISKKLAIEKKEYDFVFLDDYYFQPDFGVEDDFDGNEAKIKELTLVSLSGCKYTNRFYSIHFKNTLSKKDKERTTKVQNIGKQMILIRINDNGIYDLKFFELFFYAINQYINKYGGASKDIITFVLLNKSKQEVLKMRYYLKELEYNFQYELQ